MQISIIGLGWFGLPLARLLQKDGHTILGTTRTPSKLEALSKEDIKVFALDYGSKPSEELLASDVIILNIPPSKDQLEWFKSWDWKNKKIIFISSTSAFPVPDSEGGKILLAEENWIKESFSEWCILRFGGLLGAGRHPGKFLSGRKDLKGRLWPVNLIHLDDCLQFTKIVIEKDLYQKTFHVVSDDHRPREEFYGGYCLHKHLPLPEFDQTDSSSGKLVPNDEMKTYFTPSRNLWED